jgi:hypothetical protein
MQMRACPCRRPAHCKDCSCLASLPPTGFPSLLIVILFFPFSVAFHAAFQRPLRSFFLSGTCPYSRCYPERHSARPMGLFLTSDGHWKGWLGALLCCCAVSQDESPHARECERSRGTQSHLLSRSTSLTLTLGQLQPKLKYVILNLYLEPSNYPQHPCRRLCCKPTPQTRYSPPTAINAMCTHERHRSSHSTLEAAHCSAVNLIMAGNEAPSAMRSGPA